MTTTIRATSTLRNPAWKAAKGSHKPDVITRRPIVRLFRIMLDLNALQMGAFG